MIGDERTLGASTLWGGEVDANTEMWLWPDEPVVDTEVVVVSQPVGGMVVELPDQVEQERQALEAEKARAKDAAQHGRALLAFAKSEPRVTVPLSAVSAGYQLTLAEAYDRLQAHAVTVHADDDGALRFEAPERFHPNPLDDMAIHPSVMTAIRVLDASRPVVYALLKQKRKLPDRVPGVGGGIA